MSNVLLDVAPLLSGVTYDEKGRVAGAKATILIWILKKSHADSASWETEFINRVFSHNHSLPEGAKIFALAQRSFKDLLHQVLDSNMIILFCGLSLIAIYVTVMIGRFNVIQQRVYLSLMGVSVVGQALLSSYGVCSYMGLVSSPVHSILPFLLLGIGVDDMFVIMQSLENLPEAERNQKIHIRIANALRKSGSSITVTSLTNIAAFATGIATTMPFLKSFCVFAVCGIFFLYVFEISFFVSCLVIDERRLELTKEGFCCRQRPNWQPNECSQKNVQRRFFEGVASKYLVKKVVKFGILLVTFGFLAVNGSSVTKLEKHFDPLWYLDQDSYPIKFYETLTQYFPKLGNRAGVYLTGVDYYTDRPALLAFVDTLRSNPYINNQTLEPWFLSYEKWLIHKNYGDCPSTNDFDHFELNFKRCKIL